LFRHNEDQTSQVLFLQAFQVFMDCDIFTPSLAPFLRRTCGAEWFVREFPAENIEHQEETNSIWSAYLTPTLISNKAGTGTTSDSYSVFGYQPNLVERQFGLIQNRPSSFFMTRDDIKRPENEQQWRAYFSEFSKVIANFTPLRFKLSYECTRSFFNWWRGYFNDRREDVNLDTLLSELISAFESSQRKMTKRENGTRI